MTTNKLIKISVASLLLSAVAMAQSAQLFQLNRDGFSFPNYSGPQQTKDLTPVAMERLCGPDACARGTGSSCALSGAARALMDQLNKTIQGGRCDGMATVAQMVQKRKMQLSRLDAKAKTTYQLKRTPRVASEIGYYWATQLTDPTDSSKRKNLKPNQMLQILRDPGNESYSIHMYNTYKDQYGRLNYTNGHAVTAIRVTDFNNNTARVYIYDNNFPNQTRFITVYKNTNTWTYGGYPLKNYETKVLNLVPLTARLAQQSCWVSGNDDVRPHRKPQPAKPQPAKPQPPKPQPAQPQQQQQWDDEYEDDGQYYEDDQTEVQVISDGFKIISEIFNLFAGATVMPIPDTTSSSVYKMPSGVERRFKLRANNLGAKTPTDLYVSSGAHIMALEGLRPHRGQEDDVVLGADGESLGYSTKFAQKITVRINETYVGPDYEVKIKPVARKGGFEIHVRNIIDDESKNHELELELKNKDGTPAYYTLEMTRISDTGDDNFTHRSIRELVVLPGQKDRIRYGEWVKDKQPLEVEDVVDGKVVKETLVPDED